MNRKESAICIFKQFLENLKMLPPENTTENGDPRRSVFNYLSYTKLTVFSYFDILLEHPLGI
ncbi:hypothetical protein [Treponema bryantii]|nr:hypothetical protein [Treponema bryantii]